MRIDTVARNYSQTTAGSLLKQRADSLLTLTLSSHVWQINQIRRYKCLIDEYIRDIVVCERNMRIRFIVIWETGEQTNKRLSRILAISFSSARKIINLDKHLWP